MVGVAPISYRTPPSHSFCPLSGAWPHPVRPTAGVPSARGISDHPHPQHGHMPSPAYLPHPAFYSPIPHPGMLYPYMPHPYPPPSAPMPDSNSRKRAAPEETQPSRNKRKRSNGRDAVESEPCVTFIGESTTLHVFPIQANGSRRGYTTNKRNQAAQIAAQNGMLYPGLSAPHVRYRFRAVSSSFLFCHSPTASIHARIGPKYQ
jgi:hypothetical protein